MRTPTQAALKARARAMLVAMTERSRWIYALPRVGSFATAGAILEAQALARRAEAAAGRARCYESEDGEQRVALLESDALDAVLLEGDGEAVVPVIKQVVEATGFIPQSALWAEALDVAAPGTGRALRLLAHMCVAWDEDWLDLFLLHLASPDAAVRHDAAAALTLAAMVARDPGPALELLAEACRRERFPKLAETMREAAKALRDEPLLRQNGGANRW